MCLQLGARAAKLRGLSAEIEYRDGPVVESARVDVLTLTDTSRGFAASATFFVTKGDGVDCTGCAVLSVAGLG